MYNKTVISRYSYKIMVCRDTTMALKDMDKLQQVVRPPFGSDVLWSSFSVGRHVPSLDVEGRCTSTMIRLSDTIVNDLATLELIANQRYGLLLRVRPI